MGDDEKEKKRPNAKYKLSREKIQTAEVIRHYDRERRLEKASQAVRDLYKEQPRRRFGLFHSIAGSRPGAMLFGTIVILCAVMIMLSLFGFTGDSRELDGNIIYVNGKKHEGTVIIEVLKKPRKDKIARGMKAYTGAVDIAVFPPAKSGADQNQRPEDIYYHRIFFSNEREERFRFTVPFAPGELSFIFMTEKKSRNLTIKPLD